MLEKQVKKQLKAILRHEVALLCRQDDRFWKEPIIETIRELRAAKLRAVFFGGVLRSLLISRLHHHKPGRPRDIDIVVQGQSLDSLREHFAGFISRETRFGGLQLRRSQWQFDVWPLERTWAFISDELNAPTFSNLPRTTFFNLESIAAEIWPQPGQPRMIYSGDDQFFDGIMNEVLELNREENPYPGLGVVRALVLAARLDFRLGPRLAKYVAQNGTRMTVDDLEEIQRDHYGIVGQEGRTLREWIAFVEDCVSRKEEFVQLPSPRQLSLWSSKPEMSRVHIYFLRAKQSDTLENPHAVLPARSRFLNHKR